MSRDDLDELSEHERARRVFGDADARFALSALSGPYLPWGSGSMRPAGLVAVCNDIVLNDRHHIVELGSGVSTVLLTRLLGQLAAPAEHRLVAVEHDARWRRWVVAQLARERVGAEVLVVEARLRPWTSVGGGPDWYDRAAVDGVIGSVDLLVVDGPPAFEAGRGQARHPALAVFRDRLVPGATVVLDDIERPGEQEVLRRWQDEFDLTFHRHDGGIALATVA